MGLNLEKLAELIENPVDTVTYNKGHEVKLNLPDPMKDVVSGVLQSSSRRFDSGAYTDILNPQDIRLGDLEWLDEARAANQSAGRLIGHAAGQLGTTIVGDVITGLGSIISLPRTAIHALRTIWDEDAKADFDRVFTEGLGAELMKAGKSVSDWGREAMVIHQTKQAQKGGFGGGMSDATWWASMFPTVGSAVASMVPVVSSLKGLSLAGKGLQAISSATKLGRAANALGRGLSSKATQVIMGGIMGGHLDVAMEVAHGRDEQIRYAKSLGMSDEEAVKFASEYAAEAYKDGILYGLIFNTIEMATLLNTPGNIITGTKANKFLDEGLASIKKQGSKATIGKIDDIKLSKIDYAKSFGKKAKDFITMGVSEGLEEMRVDLALQEGEVKAKEALGLEDYRHDISEIGRWGDLASKTNSWDSFIWGAIGGMFLGAGRGLIQNVLYSKEQQKFEADRVTNILNSVQKLAKVLETTDGTLDLKIVNKEVEITNPDGTTRKEFRPVVNQPLEELMPMIIALSSESNSYSYVKNYLDSVASLSDQEFSEIYGDASKKEVANLLSKQFDIAAQIINKNKSINVDPEVAPMVRKSLNTQEYMLHYYTEQRKKIQTELKRLHKLRERYNLADIDNKLDSLERERDEYSTEINSLTANLAEVDEQIKATQRSIESTREAIVSAENDIIGLEAEIHNRQNRLQELYSDHRIAKARIFELSRDKKNSRSKAMSEAKAEFKRINLEIDSLNSEITSLEEQLNDRLISPVYRHKSLTGDSAVLEARLDELQSKREGLIKEQESATKIYTSLDQELQEYREAKPRIAQQYDEAKAKNQTEDIDAQDTTEENLIKLNDDLNRTIDGLERSLTTDRQKTIEKLAEGSKKVIQAQKEIEKLKAEEEKKAKELEKKKEKEEKRKKRLGNKSEETTENKSSQTETVDSTTQTTTGTEPTSTEEEKPVDTTATDEEFDDDDLTTIISQSDKNGTSYEVQTSPDNSQKGRILGVKIGAISISKGDKIILHNKVYTINKIEVVDDEIKITINDGRVDTVYGVEELVEKGIAKLDSKDNLIYNKLNKIESDLNSTTNLEQQLKYIIDHLSDIKNILNSNTRNPIVLEYDMMILRRLQDIYESAFAKDSIKNKYTNKWKEASKANNFEFRSYFNNIYTAINRANFINHMLTLIDLGSMADFDTVVKDANGNTSVRRNAQKAKLIDDIVNELQNIANQLFTNDYIGFDFTNTFDFKFRSDINTNTIPIINQGLTNILNLDIASAIPWFKDVIDNATFKITAEFNNRVNKLISEKLKDTQAGSYIEVLNNYINSLLSNSEFATDLPLIQDLKEYLNTLHRIVTNYTSGKPVDASDITLVDELYNKLNSILISNTLKDIKANIQTQYGFDINDKLANNLLTGKLHTYYSNLKQAQALYYTAITTTRVDSPIESSNYVLFALDLLNDIDSDLDEIVELAKDAIEKGKSINTILSEQLKSLITLFDEIIARMRINNIFSIDTFDYESILLGLLQLPGGYEMVRDNYQNIFNALQVLFSKNSLLRVENLITTFKKEGNLDMEAQVILTRLENLKNSVDSDPFTNLVNSGKYSITEGISKSWINEFLDNNRIQLFERVNHEGMRRLTPAIYEELAKSEVYDASRNTFKTQTINLFGETFTAEEIFEQLKALDVEQEFSVEKIEIDGKEYFNIYKTLEDGRKFIVERIGLSDSDTYMGIPLSQTTNAGTVYYSSVFGNIHGLSKEIGDFISKGLKSKTYEVIKEFYQLFKQYEVGKKYNEHYDDAMKILSKLETMGDNGSATIESINQLLNKVHPEFDHSDIEMHHLETLYRIITPMFYNLRDVSKIKLNKTYITAAYKNINGKLNQDFYHVQQLKSEYELDENTTVVLKGINKSPILFTDRKTTNNLDSVVSKDGSLNGTPVIEIVSRQPAPEGGTSSVQGSTTVSSLTLAENVKDDTISQHRMSKENNHHELYVKVKSNSTSEGYSYIPIVRGTLQTINIEKDVEVEELQKYMIDQVIANISKLIVNPYYTFSKDSSPAELDAYYNTLAELSKYIITDEARVSDKGSGFFKVGGVFNNNDGTKSKSIIFRIGLSSSRSSNRLSTYEVSLDVVYKDDNTIDHINVYKHLVSTNGRYHKNETPVLSKKFKSSYKEGVVPVTRKTTEGGITKTVTDTKNLKRHVITFDEKSDVESVLNAVLGEIVGNMYRSVNTTWIEKRDDASAYGYGEVYYEKNEKGVYVRKYKSLGTTEPYTVNSVKFDSYQDFLIKTGAVQISATAIKSKNGTILSNHDITSNVPAMWFKTKNTIENETEEQRRNIPKPVEDDKAIIRNTIQSLASDSDLWFKELSSNFDLYRNLGIIEGDVSLKTLEVLRQLFTDGIINRNIKLVINNKMGANARMSIHTKNGISTFNVNGRYLNDPAFTKSGFGAYMLHESLHAYMNTLVGTPQYNEMINKLQNLRTELVDATKSTLNDFNTKFNTNLTEEEYRYLKEYLDKSKPSKNAKVNLATQEMITYALTDRKVADILNRIKYVSDEQTKQSSESFWKKLIKVLLDILGIGVKNKTVLNEIKSIIENTYGIIGGVEITTEVGVQPTSLPAQSDNIVNDTNTNPNSESTETVENDDSGIDISDIDDSSDLFSETFETANREVGYTPALTTIENNMDKILKSQRNLLSSSAELINDFKDKYTDALNEKIC